jgi:hypothetical protein
VKALVDAADGSVWRKTAAVYTSILRRHSWKGGPPVGTTRNLGELPQFTTLELLNKDFF